MNYLNYKTLVVLILWMGITYTQSVTVRYIYGDEPGVGPQIFGQWELIDSNNNSQTFESGETVEVNPFEYYIIRVSEGASTTEGGENDVSFLLYDEIIANINLSNSYFNMESVDQINVNYYDKFPIEFDVTADIEEVYIFDPWRWDEYGISVSEFISVQDWLVEGDGEVFLERGYSIDDLVPPFYQLKAKRLVATSGTGNDGIYRTDYWGGEGIDIHPIEIIIPYYFEMPEHITEDFYYLSPVIFDDVELIEMQIEYFLLSQQEQNVDSEKIIVYLNEELIISPGSEITFNNIWEFEVLGLISVGGEGGSQVLLTHDETNSTWDEITLSMNSTSSFINTTIINSGRAILINDIGVVNQITGIISFLNCSFMNESSIYIQGEYEDIETSGLISFDYCQFQSGVFLGNLTQPILITNSVFENSRVGGDFFRGNLTVDGNYFVKDDQSDDNTCISFRQNFGILDVKKNLFDCQSLNTDEPMIFVDNYNALHNFELYLVNNTILTNQIDLGIDINVQYEHQINLINNIVSSENEEYSEIAFNLHQTNESDNINYNLVNHFNSPFVDNGGTIDPYPGMGNFEDNPLVNSDFTLQENSPCIDEGDPNLDLDGDGFPDLDPDNTRLDIGAFYFHQIMGDANLDGTVNIIDIVTTVYYLIQLIEFDYNQFRIADINEDGLINVNDIIIIINIILDIPNTSNNQAAVYLSGMSEAMNNGAAHRYTLHMLNEQDVPILHFKLSFNNKIPLQLSKTARSQGMELDYNYEDETGILHIVIYNLTGGKIASGFGPILEMTLESTALGRDSDLTDGSEFLLTHLTNNPDNLLPVVILNEEDMNRKIDGLTADNALPQTYTLHPVYPNPFNPVTTIKYDLPEEAHVSILVYDILGQNVQTLVSTHQSAGSYSLDWQADAIPSGVYFVRMFASNKTFTQKVMVLK